MPFLRISVTPGCTDKGYMPAAASRADPIEVQLRYRCTFRTEEYNTRPYLEHFRSSAFFSALLVRERGAPGTLETLTIVFLIQNYRAFVRERLAKIPISSPEFLIFGDRRR